MASHLIAKGIAFTIGSVALIGAIYAPIGIYKSFKEDRIDAINHYNLVPADTGSRLARSLSSGYISNGSH